MEITRLIKAAKNKNFKFEVEYPMSCVQKKTSYPTVLFRFTAGKGVWYNFWAYTISSDNVNLIHNIDTMFFERYSQNTGRSVKSFNAEYKALSILGIQL